MAAEPVSSYRTESTAPVVVLAGLRSGSTLLRFVLDSHPAIACPAPAEITAWCARSTQTWRRLEGGGAELSTVAASSIRSSVDAVFSARLAATGKRRWSDVSIDSAPSAGAIARLYPQAQFICVYRHCLDVIDSGLEAFPWGIDADALEPFVARHPGNNVAALADYWLWSTRAILAFESAHSQRCHRVLYEEFVSTPEASAAEMFTFLGEGVVAGITRRCFEDDHGPPGPSDQKIWATSQINRRSVGRGARIPLSRIPDRIRGSVTKVLSELGYSGLAAPYRNLADDVEIADGAEVESPFLEAAKADIDDTLEARLTRALADLRAVPEPWRWVLGRRPIKLSVVGSDPAEASHWLVGVDPPVVTRRPLEPESGVAWAVTADAIALRDVLSGELNLASALNQRRLRISGLPDALARPDDRAARSWPAPAHIRLQIMTQLFTRGGGDG